MGSRKRSAGAPKPSEIVAMVRALHLAEPQLTESELVDRLLKQTPPLLRFKSELWKAARDVLASS